MQKQLTILITNYNTSDFIELLVYSLKKLTKNDYNILINDNGSKKNDLAKLIKLSEKHSNIFLHFRDSKTERASLAHGRALDELMQMANTKYTAIFDSDTAILQKDWDESLINKLNEKVKIIGTPLSNKVSALKGDGIKTYDFPFQFVLLFETDIFKRLDISWQPKEKLEKGFDTAWQLKPKFTLAGFEGEIFIEENTRYYKQGPFHELIGVAEYYLNENSNIFASHFARGSTLGSSKYRKGTNFIYRIPKIGRLFRNHRGKKDKQKWINICHKIIDKEVGL